MKKNNIAVSVLCMVYNHEKYLRECLDSLVNQKTTFTYEILVHDDASTDQSKKIIEEYYRRFPDKIVPIYESENQYSKGVMIDKEILLPKARGKYFCFCEGDDYWICSDKLQKQYDFLEKNPNYTFCVHNSIAVDRNSNKLYDILTSKDGGDLSCADFIANGGEFVSTNAIFSYLSLARNLPKYFNYMTLDYFWQIYLSSCGKTYCFKDEMSAYRVESEESWTVKNVRDKEKSIVFKKKLIHGLELINEEMNYQYDDLFKERIYVLEYAIMELTRDYKKMKEPPYNKIRKQQPLKVRMKYFLYEHFPFLFKILYRVVKGEKAK